MATSRENDENRKWNIWHLVLAILIFAWIGGSHFFLKKASPWGGPTNITQQTVNATNLAGMFSNTNQTVFSLMSLSNGNWVFKIKPKYDVGETVIVNYFYIKAVITERSGSDSYVVVYKDNSRVLHTITLPRTLLLCPPSGILLLD